MTWVQKYQVPSNSSDNIYTVGISDEGTWACSCIGWTRHMPRKNCVHIKSVLRMMGNEAALRRDLKENYPAERYKKTAVQAESKHDPMKPRGRLIDLPD